MVKGIRRTKLLFSKLYEQAGFRQLLLAASVVISTVACVLRAIIVNLLTAGVLHFSC